MSSIYVIAAGTDFSTGILSSRLSASAIVLFHVNSPAPAIPKTKLSEICDEVARTGESVIVTRRGRPLVRVTPADLYATRSSAV